MKPKNCFRILSLIGWVALVIGCASQNDLYTLDDRLIDLERRTAQLEKSNQELRQYLSESKRQGQTQGQKLRNQSASLRASLDELGESLQDLRGQLDEKAYTLKQNDHRADETRRLLEKRLGSLEDESRRSLTRTQRIEQYLNLESTLRSKPQTRQPAASTKPQPAATAMSADQLYLLAKQSFDGGDMAAAREGFETLLKQHPKSRHADNAQFWIGESYYREKWYEKAILEYQKVIEKYSKGNKIQASLLKQGFAFDNLGDKANARLILKELVKKYPQSKEAKIARKKLEGF